MSTNMGAKKKSGGRRGGRGNGAGGSAAAGDEEEEESESSSSSSSSGTLTPDLSENLEVIHATNVYDAHIKHCPLYLNNFRQPPEQQEVLLMF